MRWGGCDAIPGEARHRSTGRSAFPPPKRANDLVDARNVIADIRAEHALAQQRQLVAGLRRLLEFEVLGVLHHLLFEPLDFLAQAASRTCPRTSRASAASFSSALGVVGVVDAVDNVA